MRIALGIEYDGRPYCGWQYQDHSPSVQATLEQALSSVADQPIRVICAGRTDTGVHAAEQIVHFDTDVVRDEKAWIRGTNVNLPKSISVLWARNVSDRFHARFSAVRRR
jgi:tRNA pseudouridine38-40 synthase